MARGRRRDLRRDQRFDRDVTPRSPVQLTPLWTGPFLPQAPAEGAWRPRPERISGVPLAGKGLLGTLIRYPYEVRDEKEYVDDIQDVKITKDMLDLAKHLVNQKAADFEPERFEDRYEEAVTELINAKRQGKAIGPRPRPGGGNVVDLRGCCVFLFLKPGGLPWIAGDFTNHYCGAAIPVRRVSLVSELSRSGGTI
jgi:hypothetical protein